MADGENVAARYGIGTAEQHDLKLRRYQQYQEALVNDRAFQKRYMVDAPLSDSRFRKQTGVLAADEGIFPTTAEAMARLKPVKEGGTITFGGRFIRRRQCRRYHAASKHARHRRTRSRSKCRLGMVRVEPGWLRLRRRRSHVLKAVWASPRSMP
jgi:acetyl-CoA acetyltransferase